MIGANGPTTKGTFALRFVRETIRLNGLCEMSCVNLTDQQNRALPPARQYKEIS